MGPVERDPDLAEVSMWVSETSGKTKDLEFEP